MKVIVPHDLDGRSVGLIRHLAAFISADHGYMLERANIDRAVIFCGEGGDVSIDSDDIQIMTSWLALEHETHGDCRDKMGLVRACKSNNVMQNAAINAFLARIGDVCGKRNISQVALSHDVDRISGIDKWLLGKRMINSFRHMARLRFRDAADEIYRSFISVPKYDDLDDIMELEEKHGLRSTFFFLGGPGGRYGARYKIRDLRAIMRRMDENGWEVGLHLNFYAWHDREEIFREKLEIENILGHKIDGCRVHYLHFDDDTIEHIRAAGFLYDSSVGYADAVAFRSAIAAPHYYFQNRSLDMINNIVEIPISFMDCAAYHGHGWNNQQCTKRIRQLCEDYRHYATLSFLWHTGTLDNADCPGWGYGYRYLLEMIRANGFRVMTHRDIANEFVRNISRINGDVSEC